MIEAMEEKETYLSQFARLEERLAGNRQPWVHRICKAAMAQFTGLGFPTTRHEEWRFTNVAPLTKIPFHPVADDELDGVEAESLKQFSFGGLDCIRLVFVNGRFSGELSSVRPLHNGMKVTSLAAALDSDRERVEPYLARHAGYQDHAFVALNTAFVEDGAFVYVPPGKIVEHPVHLLFLSTSLDEPKVSHPRNLIVVGDNSQITIVESYVGLDGGLYFTNAVTEIIAGQNAVIDHCKLQQESAKAFHIATQAVHQDRGSNFTSHSISLGGALVRNDVNARLDAEDVECTLNGLYMAGGHQLVDNHTSIDHAKPHCSSHEVYKGVLDGKSKGVFNGKIIVRPDAQKTDAKQTNKNLLLSADAVIDTKPQLQIYADDVKCTHGATVGQLDKDAIFYLRSRGIGQEDARNMLTYAFANDILSRIKIDEVRTHLDAALLSWLPKGQEMKEALC
jgi:Fe-S cluster assembly protein SufD